MNFFSRFFKPKPTNQGAQVQSGQPLAVISRTDPMTGYKRPISAVGRPDPTLPLPSERFDARPGFGYWQGRATK